MSRQNRIGPKISPLLTVGQLYADPTPVILLVLGIFETVKPEVISSDPRLEEVLKKGLLSLGKEPRIRDYKIRDLPEDFESSIRELARKIRDHHRDIPHLILPDDLGKRASLTVQMCIVNILNEAQVEILRVWTRGQATKLKAALVALKTECPSLSDYFVCLQVNQALPSTDIFIPRLEEKIGMPDPNAHRLDVD